MQLGLFVGIQFVEVFYQIVNCFYLFEEWFQFIQWQCGWVVVFCVVWIWMCFNKQIGDIYCYIGVGQFVYLCMMIVGGCVKWVVVLQCVGDVENDW